MVSMKLSEICHAAEGQFVGPEELLASDILDVVIDSRAAVEGTLYVPIIGERFDGHSFIDAARQNGAACTLTDRPLANPPYILVSDTLLALQRIAKYYRNQFDIPVIGVTGSVGKTSTKEMVSAVLSARYQVLKTTGSMNNQTGVPLTLFRLNRAHTAAVIEMGTNHFGEIAALAEIVEPTVCLFTNIGVAHIEFFGSREGILKGKTEMLQGMRPGGAILANGDDDMLVRIPGAVFYGLNENCHIRGIDIEDKGLAGVSFTVCYEGKKAPVFVPAPGLHSVSNALAAIACGLQLHMQLEELAEGVSAYHAESGRMCIKKSSRYTVLDDTYNANPTSVTAALDVLEKVEGRRIAILGDMLELGEQSAEFHEVIGAYAASHGIDLILCVGPESEQTFLGAQSIHGEKAHYFKTQADLLYFLPTLLKDHDTVLVKASRGMHLENTVSFLLEEEKA